MPDPALVPEVAIWTDAQRAGLVAAVLRQMGSAVRVIGIGGRRGAPVEQLAQQFACNADDDLRRLLLEKPPTFVLLAGSEPMTLHDLMGALLPETTAITLEPVDLLTEARSHHRGSGELAGRVIQAPAFIRAPGWQSAADPLAVIGPAACLSVTSLGLLGENSLFARLFDAWYTLASVGTIPESIDASLSCRANPPEHVDQISGHVCAHARFAGGCSATIVVSDHAALRSRSLLAMGPGGQYHVTDTGYELLDVKGQIIDTHSSKESVADYAGQIAADWLGILSRPPRTNGPEQSQRAAAAMACCQACWLSCRTGQPENPAQIMNLR